MVGGVKAEDTCQAALNADLGGGKYICTNNTSDILNAIEEGKSATVKIMKDFDVASSITLNKDVTYDLNGHTLTFKNGGKYAVEGADVTFKNGNVVIESGVAGNSFGVTSTDNASTLTLDVKVESETTTAIVGIYDATKATEVNINGTWNVKGELVDCAADMDKNTTVNLNATVTGEVATALVTLDAGSTVVNVNGGSYTADKTVFVVTNGTLNINNGIIKSTESDTIVVNTPTDAHKNALNIAGGNIIATGEEKYSVAYKTSADAKTGVYTISGGEFTSGKDKDGKQLPALYTTAWNFLDNHKAMISRGTFTGSIIGDVMVGSKVYQTAESARAILIGDATVTEKDGVVVIGEGASEEQAEEPKAPESQEATGNTTDAKNPGTSDNFMSLVSLVSASAAGLFIAFKKARLFAEISDIITSWK